MAQARVVRAIAGLAIAALAVTGLAGCDGPTVAQGRITASGTGAHPVGVVVSAYANDTETVVDEVLTDADGRYRFGENALPPGTYRLRFNHDVWWGGTSWATATPVTVSTETPLTVSPTITYRPGRLTGTIAGPYGAGVSATNLLGGPPVAKGFTVDADPDTPGFQYVIEDVPAGSYRVRFLRNDCSNCIFAEWVYSGSALVASAAPTHTVAAGSTTSGVDTDFPPAPAFETTITDGTPELKTDVHGLVLSADTLEHVNDIYWSRAYVTFRGRTPAIPVRIFLHDPTNRMRSAFVGATTSDPFGTVFGSAEEIPAELTMSGRDCDPAVFTPGAAHTEADIAGKVLINCDLSGTDLSGFDLRGTELQNVDLTDSRLVGADLTEVDLDYANLTRSDLTGATITGARAHGATYQDTICADGRVTSSGSPLEECIPR